MNQQQLEEMVRRSFEFLETTAGFKLRATTFDRDEASFLFSHENVFVRLHITGSNVSGVDVGRFESAERAHVVENYGLHDVLLAFEPKFRLEAFIKQGSSLQHQLSAWTTLLSVCRGNLLVGDFSRRREFKRIRARRRRLDNQRRWGTATGETPRFDTRPTLAALFADSSNEGQLSARAYQAYWDYDYPLIEIAEFLDTGVNRVQSLLDAWDGIE